VVPVRIETSDEEAKDRSAVAIKAAASQVEADFVFSIMEAWGLPKDKLTRHQEILDRYGSIANSPFKIDTVSFVLETHYGIWMAQLPIMRKGVSKKRHTFGSVALRFVDGAEGRFAGLLPASVDGASGSTRLH
jgi:hypothetical protein